MPTFVFPDTEKDSKCKLSPLGREQPTDSSLPLWRTQGCLCKCQSHAAHSAILHMLRSACCASRAWYKTHGKNQVYRKMTKQSKIVPLANSQIAILKVAPSCFVWLFTVIIVIIVVGRLCFMAFSDRFAKNLSWQQRKKITYQGQFVEKMVSV